MALTVIARGLTYVVSNSHGDAEGPRCGLYHADTRFLKRIALLAPGYAVRYVDSRLPKPWLHVATAVLERGGQRLLLVREREVGHGWTAERIRVYGGPASLRLRLEYEPDFCDVFEVRGFRGLGPARRRFGSTAGYAAYMGLDGCLREVRVVAPSADVGDGYAEWSANTTPGGAVFHVEFRLRAEYRRTPLLLPRAVSPGLAPRVHAENPALDAALARASEELEACTLLVPGGAVVAAGYPDYACIFGRDSLIVGFFLLPFAPWYARGALAAMSRLQCRAEAPWSDGEPGKVPHEYRLGELSVSGRVPFSPYYGSVDATPLYIALAAEYLSWTGDRDFVREIAEHLERALSWLVGNLERHGGLLAYERRSPLGLENQGWKDSSDGVLRADGSRPRPPVAVVEAQGYAYWALRSAEELAEEGLLDTPGLDDLARRVASRLNDFWMPRASFYALALDGDGVRCGLVSSNPGHLLVTGIPVRLDKLASRLAMPDLLGKWGLRTLSSSEPIYDPSSYHRGSTWPHDTAMVALGAARRGLSKLASDLSSRVLLLAAAEFDRLAEAYVGSDTPAPIPLERACRPQAWSAAAVFAAVHALIRLDPHGGGANPRVPGWVGRLTALYGVGDVLLLVRAAGNSYQIRSL